jgi:hypothetical protein
MSIRLRIVALLGVLVALAAVTVGAAAYRTTKRSGSGRTR